MNTPSVGTKIEIEFILNTSPNILFSRLSSPEGLSEWFADDVKIQDNIYTFTWDETEQSAQLVTLKDNKLVRFRWLDKDEVEDAMFEFRILKHELTGDLALHVTEIVAEEDAEDSVSLWNYQIGELKRNLGI